jgi:hypothetical protein
MYRLRPSNILVEQVSGRKRKMAAGVPVTVPADLAKSVRGCPQSLHST